jgi:hypothetical protein
MTAYAAPAPTVATQRNIYLHHDGTASDDSLFYNAELLL